MTQSVRNTLVTRPSIYIASNAPVALAARRYTVMITIGTKAIAAANGRLFASADVVVDDVADEVRVLPADE